MAFIGTRKLTLQIDALEVAPDVSAVTIESGDTDSDFVSFASAAAGGGRDYVMHLTLAQDAAAGTLWSKVWDEAGETIPYVLRPYGNAVATALQPHFTGSVIIHEPDGELLGGEADASVSAVMTIEVEWPCEAKPLRITA
jgi:hypothetical protein